MNKLREKMLQKTNAEYSKYKNTLLRLSREEIYERSLETAVKREIRMFLETAELSPSDIRILSECSEPITMIYFGWLREDTSLLENLSETVHNLTESLQRKKYMERR